jgi:hypothetical protein
MSKKGMPGLGTVVTIAILLLLMVSVATFIIKGNKVMGKIGDMTTCGVKKVIPGVCVSNETTCENDFKGKSSYGLMDCEDEAQFCCLFVKQDGTDLACTNKDGKTGTCVIDGKKDCKGGKVFDTDLKDSCTSTTNKVCCVT